MFERSDSDLTPKIILNLFDFPYQYFGDRLKDKNKTLIDIACGSRLHLDLEQKFKKVYFIDKDNVGIEDKIFIGDIRNLSNFKDKTTDITFSFETIEHIEEQEQAFRELIRITKKKIVIGSVNQDGLDFIDGVEIYKAKNKKNPFHIKELGVEGFRSLIESFDYKTFFFHSIYKNGKFKMKADLNRISGLCNYALIKLT